MEKILQQIDSAIKGTLVIQNPKGYSFCMAEIEKILSELDKVPVDIEKAIEAEYPYYTQLMGPIECEIERCKVNRLRDAMRKGYSLKSSEAVDLLKEMEAYLSDNHQQGNKDARAINTISSNSVFHNRMKDIIEQFKNLK